jgi:hypothetical protein
MGKPRLNEKGIWCGVKVKISELYDESVKRASQNLMRVSLLQKKGS